MRNLWAGIRIMWATRTRFGGIKDPGKASPEMVEAITRSMVGMIRAMEAEGLDVRPGSEVAQHRYRGRV